MAFRAENSSCSGIQTISVFSPPQRAHRGGFVGLSLARDSSMPLHSHFEQLRCTCTFIVSDLPIRSRRRFHAWRHVPSERGVDAIAERIEKHSAATPVD